MFLRVKRRFKDGREHRYRSIVENHRTVDNQVVQRHVLYLGEINDGQQASWVKTIEVIQRGERRGKQMALFPADRAVPELACEAVQIHLSALDLHRPRQWGRLLAGLPTLEPVGPRWVLDPRIAPQSQKITRDTLLLKIRAAKKEAGRVYALVDLILPKPGEPVNPQTFTFRLRKEKLRELLRREGCYLLRSNLTHQDPAYLWEYYTQLTEVEQAFKELKGDLSIRPIYHQTDNRIEAHIFVAFPAYCLQVTLKFQAKQQAPGLTPRSILEKFAALQMVDVHLPTTDGRRFILSRYTQPDKDQKLLLHQLKLTLPQQPPPCLAVKGSSVPN